LQSFANDRNAMIQIRRDREYVAMQLPWGVGRTVQAVRCGAGTGRTGTLWTDCTARKRAAQQRGRALATSVFASFSSSIMINMERLRSAPHDSS
jgi:hypothetical protein